MNQEEKKTCTAEPEVYSRVVGFYRPTKLWNKGKKEEWKERNTYKTYQGEKLQLD